MSTLSYPMTDAATMLRRSLRHTLRSPDTMLMTVALPVMILLMFVYVFGGAMDISGAYINYVVPGIVLLCAGFGAGTTAVSVTTDMTNGIVDRFRTMSIGRNAVLAGHVGASLLRNLISTAVVVAIAIAIGFRPTAGPLEWLAAIGMIALFVVAISWLATALGLLARNPEAASGFTFFLMFLPYVSSAFVPPETMPTWLHWVAEHQPVTPIIETLRGLLLGGATGADALAAVGWCVAIGVAGYVWAAALYTRRTRR